MPRGLPSSVAQVRRRLASGRSDVAWARRELLYLATKATDRGEPVLAYALTNASKMPDDQLDQALADLQAAAWPERQEAPT